MSPNVSCFCWLLQKWSRVKSMQEELLRFLLRRFLKTLDNECRWQYIVVMFLKKKLVGELFCPFFRSNQSFHFCSSNFPFVYLWLPKNQQGIFNCCHVSLTSHNKDFAFRFKIQFFHMIWFMEQRFLHNHNFSLWIPFSCSKLRKLLISDWDEEHRGTTKSCLVCILVLIKVFYEQSSGSSWSSPV